MNEDITMRGAGMGGETGVPRVVALATAVADGPLYEQLVEEVGRWMPEALGEFARRAPAWATGVTLYAAPGRPEAVLFGTFHSAGRRVAQSGAVRWAWYGRGSGWRRPQWVGGLH